ncbi:hypothetical protein B0H11DRAFT_379836 [Mycena galericulata]|nr:hypothetical protein B0H11DRAFT_379836 [Mycena galericulata]
MSSTLSQHDSPQRSWWPLSSQKSKESGLKFNTLASAMGFKQKKPQPPSLTIHDPPRIVSPQQTPQLSPRPEPHQRRPYTAPGVGRPPSNSVSSSLSRVDSIEPRTPRTPDDPKAARRGSLLTLSDSDPFAARVVSLHSPDPNRLSAFSNSSANDTKSTDSANRISYASSSSQSFRLGGELSPLSVVSPVSDSGSSYMKLSNKKSGHSLRRKDVSADSTWLSNLGVDNNRFSQPDPPPKPRPVMRARGMTDGGIERSNFLRNDPFMARPAKSPPIAPNNPTRQMSLTRPTPPPSAELPPPPRSPDDPTLSLNSAGSTSSTSLTFSAEFMPIAHSQRVKPKASFEPTVDNSTWEFDSPRNPPRTLRKSMSHQSLKRGQSASSSSVAPPTEPLNIKVPRKQRSFHRLPVQAVPLQLPLSEQRSPEPAPSARKRLFSTSSSRRPSQSTLADDVRSINLIASTEGERPSTSTTPASCWIDTDPPPPRSPTHEYTPQQIMSPAEMLKVEASVNATYPRPRNASIISASTMLSDFESDFGRGLSPSSSFGGGRPRSNSDHPSVRSATSDAGNQDMFYLPMAPQPPSPPVLMSLPPPPRRTKPRAAPPLVRSHSAVATPLTPPPLRKILRPKASMEERMHKRQSIMRKPSFLDIDDEMDKDPPSIARQGSFLDLTRGSFDSVRSDDDFN